jgi:hypothetical protein
LNFIFVFIVIFYHVGQLTGAVKVKGDPFVSYKTDDGIKSINDLGLLLKFLISVGEKKMK